MDGYGSEMALFSPPDTDIGVDSIYFVSQKPSGVYSQNSPIYFRIHNNSADYVSLMDTTLEVKVKIIKKDGTAFAASDKVVSPVNNLLHSLFKQVEVEFQGVPVSQIGTNYAYKAYIDNLLNSDISKERSVLQAEMFYKDTAGAFDKVNSSSMPVNVGFLERARYLKNGNTITVSGVLKVDIFQLPKYIINGVPVDIRLWPSTDNFVLLSESDGYSLTITDCTLNVCKVRPTPQIILAHDNTIKQFPAKYTFANTTVTTHSLSSGLYDQTFEDIFQGRQVARVVVGLVNSQAFSGNEQLNPFNFHHYFLSSINLMVNGTSVVGKPLTPNFDSGDYTDAFRSLQKSKTPNTIAYKDYPNGYALYQFVLQENILDKNSKTSLKERFGNCSLSLVFSKPLPHPVTIVIFTQTQSCIEVSETRNVRLIQK